MPETDMPRRVRRLSNGQHGVVLETNEENTLVHWGTVAIPDPPRGMKEQKFTDWVPNDDLETSTEPVWYGDPETKKKTKVYDPEVFGVRPDVDVTED